MANQTREEIKALIGRQRNCPALRMAMGLVDKGYTILGAVQGSWCYTGAIFKKRHLSSPQYQGWTHLLQAARGAALGEDTILVVRQG